MCTVRHLYQQPVVLLCCHSGLAFRFSCVNQPFTTTRTPTGHVTVNRLSFQVATRSNDTTQTAFSNVKFRFSNLSPHVPSVKTCGHQLRLAGYTHDDSAYMQVSAQPAWEVSTTLKPVLMNQNQNRQMTLAQLRLIPYIGTFDRVHVRGLMAASGLLKLRYKHQSQRLNERASTSTMVSCSGTPTKQSYASKHGISLNEVSSSLRGLYS